MISTMLQILDYLRTSMLVVNEKDIIIHNVGIYNNYPTNFDASPYYLELLIKTK